MRKVFYFSKKKNIPQAFSYYLSTNASEHVTSDMNNTELLSFREDPSLRQEDRLFT